MIDQQTVDKIIDTAQIVDVVSDFVSLRRRGVNYVGLCPFHPDKSPSFYVSPSKNICKCFACGEGGTPINFLMKKEKMTFHEALRWLGRKYGIEIEEKVMNEDERRRQTDREGMFNLNEFAQKCFEDDLFNTAEGRDMGLSYFRERGLQDATIHRFHLGYALENKEDLALRAMRNGHKREYLLDGTGVGLCYGDDPNRTPICRFAGRVIFPHHSISGRCIAFGGRILQRVDHAFKKYVNSPESAIYHKSDLPYGLYEAKNEIAKQNLCYVVEGNIDVLSMSQAGFQNVIAASGTALTSEHIRVIKRFTNNCVLMFDADNAGITAALKSIDLLLLEGMNVSILLLPEGEDPDSFCRKNSSSEAERYFMTHAQDFISFKADTLMAGINRGDVYARARVAQDVCNSIALVANPIVSSILVGQVAQRLGISEQQTMQYVNQAKRNNYQAEVRKMEAEMRREQARLEREELGVSETVAEAVSQEAAQSEMNFTSPANQQPTNAQTAYPSRLTDKFERNIIKLIVRYGGSTFPYSYFDEETKSNVTNDYRVIDFIYNELSSDGIDIQHPLYARMYRRALDATEDQNLAWDSSKFFSNMYDDPEAQQMAIELMQDRYDTMGIAQNDERLNILVPRSIIELKNCIVEQQIRDLQQQLKTVSNPEDMKQIIQQLSELLKIKKAFDKDLGERVVMPTFR